MKPAKKKDAVKLLKAAGFEIIRQDGSHDVWASENGAKVAIPRHTVISSGIMRQIHLAIKSK